MSDLPQHEAKNDRIKAVVEAGLMIWKERDFGAPGYALTDKGWERAAEVFEYLVGCDVPFAGRDLRGGSVS